MAAIWRFRINVVNPQDAEKMKEYVRELSKEYSLVPTLFPDDGWYRTPHYDEVEDYVMSALPK